MHKPIKQKITFEYQIAHQYQPISDLKKNLAENGVYSVIFIMYLKCNFNFLIKVVVELMIDKEN